MRKILKFSIDKNSLQIFSMKRNIFKMDKSLQFLIHFLKSKYSNSFAFNLCFPMFFEASLFSLQLIVKQCFTCVYSPVRGIIVNKKRTNYIQERYGKTVISKKRVLQIVQNLQIKLKYCFLIIRSMYQNTKLIIEKKISFKKYSRIQIHQMFFFSKNFVFEYISDYLIYLETENANIERRLIKN